MTYTSEIETELRQKVDAVLEDETRIDGFTMPEHLAVALILNRMDMLESAGFTMLEAMERVGVASGLPKGGAQASRPSAAPASPLGGAHVTLADVLAETAQ